MDDPMARAYSEDLRQRILQAYDEGILVEDIYVLYKVSRSWVYSLIQQRRETGTHAPRKQRHGPTKKLAPYEKEVRQLVAEPPDATLVELCEMLSEHVSVSTTTLCDFLYHLKITWKKTLRSSEQQRPDVAAQREEWKKLQEVLDIRKLVFTDETWVKTNMTPLDGWAEIGQRWRDSVPHGHWKTTTFLGAFRCSGLTAPMVIDGAMNGDGFVAYVEQILI
jgi:transposase